MLLRAIAFALTFIASASVAAAANFPGWTRTYEADSVAIMSPADNNGAVQLHLTIAEQEMGDPKVAFRKELDKAVAEMGAEISLTQRSGLREQGGMMLEALKVKTQGIDIDMLVFAYHTSNKFYQSGILAYLSSIPDTDLRVNHALDFIATAVRTKYRLTNPRDFDRTAPSAQQVTSYNNTQTAPTPPAPTATPPAQTQSGKKCERRPIWGFRVSYWCQPSGICPDRVIKGYEDVCE
ncbi:MAG: hypothetical protein KBA31_04535 [Alphaproteobacteria bacterium]|nr:hypothetical protein [Alphaproteobacteria bacterium]